MTTQELQSIKQRFGIVGNSPLINHAVGVAAQVANTNMSVLIVGESGTGKESFSKIIHQLSARKHGTFIAINCGAIPEGTIDSELFGHEKGSFTGATEARKGYFEVTDGGTIFLDEIGEMPIGTQARLLRVLENGEFIKVGSSKVQKTDVRVVAATNIKLLEAVQKKKFREDLFYRLSTVPINIPALRDRGDDIDLLFRKFAADFSETYRLKPIKLLDDAKSYLLKFKFPGNIRQLKNLVEQMSVLQVEREISLDTLIKYLPQQNNGGLFPIVIDDEKSHDSFSERDLLYKILFDLRKEFGELKSMFLELLKNPSMGDSVKEKYADYINSSGNKLPQNIRQANLPAVLETDFDPYIEDDALVVNDFEFKNDKIEDISHEVENESLSIIDKEKELIIKALKKFHNKRKLASVELGISERTLYRKLKEYGLD